MLCLLVPLVGEALLEMLRAVENAVNIPVKITLSRAITIVNSTRVKPDLNLRVSLKTRSFWYESIRYTLLQLENF